MFVKRKDYIKMLTTQTETEEAAARYMIGLGREVNIHHDILEELVDVMGMKIVIDRDGGVKLVPQSKTNCKSKVNKKGKK